MNLYEEPPFDEDSTQPVPAVDDGLGGSFDVAITSDEAAMLLNITPGLFRLLAVKADLPCLLTEDGTWYMATDVLALCRHPLVGLIIARHSSE